MSALSRAGVTARMGFGTACSAISWTLACAVPAEPDAAVEAVDPGGGEEPATPSLRPQPEDPGVTKEAPPLPGSSSAPLDGGVTTLAPSDTANEAMDASTPAAPTDVAADSPTDASPMTDASPISPPSLAESTEFIAWEDFEVTGTAGSAGGSGPLLAPLDVRGVSRARGYQDETILIAVAGDEGNNRVIALNTTALTLRDHWPHFACGDCKISEGEFGSVIATESTLYGSTDGGYRYFEIASGDFAELSAVSASREQVWLAGPFGWLGAPLESNEPLLAPPWSDAVIASVDGDSALEISAELVTLHGDTEQTVDNPCPVPADRNDWGSARHRGARVVIGCGANTVAVTDQFPEQAFELIELDEAPQWIGDAYVATATGWYGVGETRDAYAQAPLTAEERVFDHVEWGETLFRVTSEGVAVTRVEVAAR